MAINSVSGYNPAGGLASVSNSTTNMHAERRISAENERNTVEVNQPVVKSSENASQLQQDTKEQENGQAKENPENHLKSVLSVANQKIRMTNTRCEFEYHEKTKRVSIKVVDEQTDEVIREIPPEETLEMVEKIWELAGLIVDERR